MKKLVLTLMAAATLAGCKKDENPCKASDYNECTVKAPAAEIEQVKAYLARQNINAVEHCSGLFYVVDVAGAGATPDVCSSISIRYKGMLTNGNVFDSSNVSTPYWPLTSLVRGWVNGIPKMKTGGAMRLFIPPTLGYGAQDMRDGPNGPVIIPANSVLVFEVKLDGVKWPN